MPILPTYGRSVTLSPSHKAFPTRHLSCFSSWEVTALAFRILMGVTPVRKGRYTIQPSTVSSFQSYLYSFYTFSCLVVVHHFSKEWCEIHCAQAAVQQVDPEKLVAICHSHFAQFHQIQTYHHSLPLQHRAPKPRVTDWRQLCEYNCLQSVTRGSETICNGSLAKRVRIRCTDANSPNLWPIRYILWNTCSMTHLSLEWEMLIIASAPVAAQSLDYLTFTSKRLALIATQRPAYA